MIPIGWTISKDRPSCEQVKSYVDRKIQSALTKIHEEVSSPVPKEYRPGLETKIDQRLKAHLNFLQGPKDQFGFTETEYDACQSWYRIPLKIREAQSAFEAYLFVKLKNLKSVPEQFSKFQKPEIIELTNLLKTQLRYLRQYYSTAKFALSTNSFLLDKDTIEKFLDTHAQINQLKKEIFSQLSQIDQNEIPAEFRPFIQQASKNHADLLVVLNDYLNSFVGADLEKFENLLHHSVVDSNFNQKLRLLLKIESSEVAEIISKNEDAFSILQEFSYKFSRLQTVESRVKQSELLADRIMSGGLIEDHEKLSPADAKLLRSLMNFENNLELLKKAGITIPQVFFYLELINRFKKVLEKVPSPDLSKGTLFVYHGSTFDEYHYQKKTMESSVMNLITRGPATHAGIIAAEPSSKGEELYLSHILGNHLFEGYTEPFLPPYWIAYKVNLKNLVQEKVLPVIEELLGENWEGELENLWAQSKYEVESATKLPDVENGFLHQVTSVFKSSSKLTGFDQSSIESIEDRGQTKMFCSEYARLSLIATSNVFEKKLRKKLLEIAQKPEFTSQKESIEKTPHLIYHLAHEKSRIASSTPAGLVNKYQRDSKKSPDSAKYRKAILVPLDQVDTDTWANWGKLFRLPKSSNIE